MNRFLSARKACMACCLLYFVASVFAQGKEEQPQGMKMEKLITDPALRSGKLENGLTYYIRHNKMPEERAEFYIVHNAGSMQEEENQRGLAHFLEHMAFNGTKNFPSRKGIQDYAESIGMRMGENMNAYTGFDETVYMLMDVPVTREGIIDSCLLILHDWSSFLLLEDDAIEKERGVVREEWRTGRTAQLRMWEQQLPEMFPGSKYGSRLPIGSIDVINNFKGDELRDYYKKWYRPDLQAVIIVGDIDVDRVEEKIKRMFSDIPAPVNPAPVEPASVPDNSVPLISIAKDKEMTNMTLSLYYKHEKLPSSLRGTIADFITGYTKTVISLIMSERFSEIVRKANPPFVSAYAGDGDYFVSRTKGAWTTTAIVKPGELNRAFSALVAETERVRKHGFTEAEYERAKENILASYESTWKDRDKLPNSSFAQEYVRNFTEGECIPGIETEYEIIRQIVPGFPLEGIHQYVRNLFNETESEQNIAISLSGPDKEDLAYPGKNELFQMFRAATRAGVTAKEEESVSKILIPTLPRPGKITEERDDPLFGATVYTLSNGVRVAVKQTDFKNDQILMTATSPGGTTLFGDDKDIWNLKVINNTIMLGGLGEFSATNLRKALAGKNISCSAGIGVDSENLNGSVSPSDLKTLFELIYLQFTGMRIDDEAYASFEERVKSQLENHALNPMIAFSDTLTDLAYNRNPRNSRLKASDFDKIDYHRTIDMYNERYGDASDFIFTFTGSIDKDSLRPLLEQYLATLPSLNRNEKADEKMVTPFQKGKMKNHFSRQLETPKSSAALMYTGVMPYHLKNVILSQLLSHILDMVYMEQIRDYASASYGIQTTVDIRKFPEGRTSIQIYFDTDPARCDDVVRIVKSELERIAKEGPRQMHLDKSHANILKARAELKKQNDYWLGVLDTYYYYDFDVHTAYENIMESITADDVKSFTKEFLDQGNEIEVVMSPVAGGEAN